MDTKQLILSKIESRGEVRASEIISETGLSRPAVNIVFQSLRDEGKILLLGKANQARYVKATESNLKLIKASLLRFSRVFKNNRLEEDLVLRTIQRETGIFEELPKNITTIVDYAFTEMLNNAIEHSQSRTIQVIMSLNDDLLSFEVRDRGIGIFNNISQKKHLNNEMEALEDLLKGKQTTDPTRHSGEGVFFTSKIADRFSIKSGEKRVTFDNRIPDVFLTNSRVRVGTVVSFLISRNSARQLSDVFNTFTNESFEFNRTNINVDLHKAGGSCISRSQARRILSNLDNFKEINLDFKDVETIGQGFADEVFRVWQNQHPEVQIKFENANENVVFMIQHVQQN